MRIIWNVNKALTETTPLLRCTYIEWLVLWKGYTWNAGFWDVKSCMLVDGNQQFLCYSGRVAYSEDRGYRLLRFPGSCLPNYTASHAKQRFVSYYSVRSWWHTPLTLFINSECLAYTCFVKWTFSFVQHLFNGLDSPVHRSIDCVLCHVVHLNIWILQMSI